MRAKLGIEAMPETVIHAPIPTEPLPGISTGDRSLQPTISTIIAERYSMVFPVH